MFGLEEAWTIFAAVVSDFLGNEKLSNYEELVQNLISSFRLLDCKMSVKVHFAWTTSLKILMQLVMIKEKNSTNTSWSLGIKVGGTQTSWLTTDGFFLTNKKNMT